MTFYTMLNVFYAVNRSFSFIIYAENVVFHIKELYFGFYTENVTLKIHLILHKQFVWKFSCLFVTCSLCLFGFLSLCRSYPFFTDLWTVCPCFIFLQILSYFLPSLMLITVCPRSLVTWHHLIYHYQCERCLNAMSALYWKFMRHDILNAVLLIIA